MILKLYIKKSINCIKAEQNSCVGRKKMLMENIKFSLPENKLYLKVEGEQSEDINFKNIHPNIEIIKE